MTLKSALNDVQRLSSLPVTTTIVGDNEESQQLLLALARQAAQAMVRRKPWPELEASHAFLTSAAALQDDGLPADIDRFVKGSFWNVDRRRRVWPVSAQDWRRLNTGMASPAGEEYFRVRAGGLYLFPVPGAGVNMVFDYVQNTPVRSSGDAALATFEADTDTYLWGDETLKLDVLWRYKQEKGLEYAEDLKNFELWLESEFNASELSDGDDVTLAGFDGCGALPTPALSDGDWDLG